MSVLVSETADLDGTPSLVTLAGATGDLRTPKRTMLSKFGASRKHGRGAERWSGSSSCYRHRCNATDRRTQVTDHVYKSIELTGSSSTTVEDAVQNAITKAGKTMRNMHWFQVMETRGHIADGKVAHWQVTLKVGFTLEG
jgi:dodecin